MKIAIFGGSFDPPHKGHCNIIEILANQRIFDKLFILVAYRNPFKKEFRFLASKRFAWMQILTKDYQNVVCSDYEIKQERSVSTIESIFHFEKNYQPSKIYLVLGEDNFLQVTKWHRFDILKEKVEFLVFKRIDTSLCNHNSLIMGNGNNLHACRDFADTYHLTMQYFTFFSPCASSEIMKDLNSNKEQIPENIRDDVLQTYRSL